jgi:hypothetical protein
MIGPDLLGDRGAGSYGAFRESIAYKTLSYNFARVLLLPRVLQGPPGRRVQVKGKRQVCCEIASARWLANPRHGDVTALGSATQAAMSDAAYARPGPGRLIREPGLRPALR